MRTFCNLHCVVVRGGQGSCAVCCVWCEMQCVVVSAVYTCGCVCACGCGCYITLHYIILLLHYYCILQLAL